MEHWEIKELLEKANKLGAKNIQVVDFIEPQSATESGCSLVTQIPHEETSGCELAWYEK